MPRLTRDRWHVLSPYLDKAMELSGAPLAAWLDSIRDSDPAIAAELEALLDRHEAIKGEQFLEGSQACVPPAPSLVGSTIGAYTITAPAGQGGMGTVWLAERSDGRFKGRVAVKLLNISLLGGAGAERFKREGSILARLNHEGVARLIDAGMSTFMQPYLVLEYVEGENIDAYCNSRGLGIHERLRLFLDVLDAVAHAHANLIVHRDIKPSNVFVDTEGRVKLLDFGIAKLLDMDDDERSTGALTVEGGRVLTPEYAAPEQITGNQVTTATDVYALGVLLYVLLAGRHPAGPAARVPAQLIVSIVDREPPPPSQVVESKAARRQLRGDLDNIVARALQKRPADRYPSVEAFADDLRRYFSNEPVSARAATWRYRTAKFTRRHAAAIAVLAAILISLAGIVSYYTVRVARERDRAQLEARKATQIGELLAGLLTGADPYGSQVKRDPTVRELLDAGAERVGRELAGQPAVQAEMLNVIGRVYQRLGEYDKAQAMLEDSLARGVSGAVDQANRAETLNDLGVLLRERGRIDSAVQPLEEALALRRTLHGREHPDIAVTLVELGRTYVDQGKGDRAEPLLREALDMRLRLLGEENSGTATSMSDLALLLWQEGKTPEAEALFRRTLAVSRKLLGPDHPDVGSSLNNLGLIAFDRGDYAGAEALFREALEIDRRSLGNEHPELGPALNNLAHALREQDEFDEAAALVREALRISSESLEPGHPRIAMFTANLARVDLARGDAAAAEPLLRKALEARLRSFPETDWRVASVKSLLGASLVSLRRFSEAAPLLLDAEQVLKHIPGPQGREATANLGYLATLYDGLGDPAKAASYRSLAAGR